MIQKLLFLVSIIFLSGSLVSTQGLYYAIEVTSDQGTIKINDVEVIFSQKSLENIVNDHYFRTYSLGIYNGEHQRKETLEFGFINLAVSDVRVGEEFVAGESIRLSNVSFVVYAPYHDDGQEIIMYDEEGQRITQKNVNEFSRITREEPNNAKEEKNSQRDARGTALKKNNLRQYSFAYGLILIVVIIVLYALLRRTSQKKR